MKNYKKKNISDNPRVDSASQVQVGCAQVWSDEPLPPALSQPHSVLR